MKKYKVKPEFREAVKAVLGLDTMLDLCTEHGFYIDKLQQLKVLDIWFDELTEEWKEPAIIIDGGFDSATHKKAKLLIRMQSWADYHNKEDGFVADWNDGEANKFGLDIQSGEIIRSRSRNINSFLFQIYVGSTDRCTQLHDYFKSDIQELIKFGVI